MICSHSNIVEESHKTKVHVQLLMTVEQSHTRIVSYEVHFGFLVASQHHDVFENASRRSPGQAGQFEAVPVQMNRMYIVTRIAHAKTIAFPLFQVKCGRRRSLVIGYEMPLIAQRLNPLSAALSFAKVISMVSSAGGAAAPGFAKRA